MDQDEAVSWSMRLTLSFRIYFAHPPIYYSYAWNRWSLLSLPCNQVGRISTPVTSAITLLTRLELLILPAGKCVYRLRILPWGKEAGSLLPSGSTTTIILILCLSMGSGTTIPFTFTLALWGKERLRLSQERSAPGHLWGVHYICHLFLNSRAIKRW